MTTALTLENYTFGYARTDSQKANRNKMRFIKMGDSKEKGILVDRIIGQWWADGCSRNGEIQAECALDVRQTEDKGVVAYIYHPDIDRIEVPEYISGCDLDIADNHDNCQIATDQKFEQGRKSHWRLCYAREIASTSDDKPCWRLRDERTDQLWFVMGYSGPMNVNWFDGGTHIFVDGPCWVDDDLIAHFGDPD